jgi:TolA-binding protein
MRFHLLAAILLAGTAAPALAQNDQVDRRVNKLEQEMRAVQRKVFPGGAGAIVEPEIRPQGQAMPLGGAPAGSAVSDLTARVDALEAQLARLTGQAEQNSFRVRQIEEGLASFRTATQARLAEIESARTVQTASAPAVEAKAAPAPVQAAATPAATPAPAAKVAAADPGEEAYLSGFRLWEERKFTQAQSALEGMAKKFPKHMRASYARNLAGRAYLDDNKPATAAKVFLSNYQIDPKGERAADSLLFLGEALMKLGKAVEACKVYDELRDVYGPNMRDFVRQRLPQARSEARCS